MDPNRFASMVQKMIYRFGNKRNAPLDSKDMHLWLQKICTSGFKRYAPLAPKDMHLWLQIVLRLRLQNMHLWQQKICTSGS
jgi:hypothetical protein